MNIAEAIREVFVPIVGKPAAEICIHESALRASKEAGALSESDMPLIETTIRKSLAPFTSGSLLDSAIAALNERVCA